VFYVVVRKFAAKPHAHGSPEPIRATE
jgi:hypothetical protein